MGERPSGRRTGSMQKCFHRAWKFTLGDATCPKQQRPQKPPDGRHIQAASRTRSPAASGGREKKRAKKMITSSLDHRSPTFELGPETRLRSTPTSIVPLTMRVLENTRDRLHGRPSSTALDQDPSSAYHGYTETSCLTCVSPSKHSKAADLTGRIGPARLGMPSAIS